MIISRAQWLLLLLILCADASALPADAPASHWAFRAPARPAVPAVKNLRWLQNPIDAFVLARLESEGVTPSPAADRATLLRRLSLDLIGLPPTPEQVRAFLADLRPDAYEHLVETLLDSPHFGERWARHWLDLARYADTSGYQIDRVRPFAWLYRNWVIDAINRDQPFDQFTIEQLAGDLLPHATSEQQTAAGFHRLTLMNHEDGVDAEEFRCKAKVDRVGTTGTVWLGLTVGCAECHNHKYDPITQREFYQLYAFFNNADEVDLPAPQPEDTARFERARKSWTEAHARLKEQLAALPSGKDPRAAALKKEIARHKRTEPKARETQALSFRERTNAASAFIHIRGDFLRKGEAVSPGTPDFLPPLPTNPAQLPPNRLDLARWIVAPSNPLTARVAVNHVWQHLFHRGLVGTPEDFGIRGEPPTHPELLDWLASEFMEGWSRKHLIRLIVTSATYRQSSRHRSELSERDPLNLWLARQNRARVESEIVRDACLSVSGLLNEDLGGPSFRPHLPEDVKKLGSAGAFSWDDSTGPEKYRRGLYIFAQRTVPYPTAMTFDQADSSQSCPRREHSATPLQALTLLNHGLFVECAQALAQRLQSAPAATTRARLAWGFELCLARPPSLAELNRLELLYTQARSVTATDTDALLVVAQTLLNLEEFLTRE